MTNPYSAPERTACLTSESQRILTALRQNAPWSRTELERLVCRLDPTWHDGVDGFPGVHGDAVDIDVFATWFLQRPQARNEVTVGTTQDVNPQALFKAEDVDR